MVTLEAQVKALRLEQGDVIVMKVPDGRQDESVGLEFSDLVNEWVGRRHLIVMIASDDDVVKVATRAAIAEEREACAKIAEVFKNRAFVDNFTLEVVAANIRARGTSG